MIEFILLFTGLFMFIGLCSYWQANADKHPVLAHISASLNSMDGFGFEQTKSKANATSPTQANTQTAASAKEQELNQEISALKQRIEHLETIVCDRNYELNEALRKLN
ncbi:hypothetical protein [Thalassotalea sp. PS06]|uniref:hypothetical protein n=1 Tax=Thalassotalea sp. PS06 TaxID=2594005 RepID=UPI0011621A14|nr:hypothetical protein [Thalassotalea sp. PS06]QDP02745.1 hypothetical protein FNC98_16175 [Thalassotalea sp. PS06]